MYMHWVLRILPAASRMFESRETPGNWSFYLFFLNTPHQFILFKIFFVLSYNLHIVNVHISGTVFSRALVEEVEFLEVNSLKISMSPCAAE